VEGRKGYAAKIVGKGISSAKVVTRPGRRPWPSIE
jgi:hypothetical protein